MEGGRKGGWGLEGKGLGHALKRAVVFCFIV